MPKAVYNKFNRGEIDPLALGRDDVDKVNNSCALMENFMPKRLGAMQYRSGSELVGSALGESYLVPFIKATNDVAMLEFSNNAMRVWIDEGNGLELVVRNAILANLENSGFDTDLSSWTDQSAGSAVAQWQTGGYLRLFGNNDDVASIYQGETIDALQVGTAHAIRIVVESGTVTLKLGESSNDDRYFSGKLAEGTHSLVFTPLSQDFRVTLENTTNDYVDVDSVQFDQTATPLTFTTDIATADLGSIRYAQSGDVVFVARKGGDQYRIERRGLRSWSLLPYKANPMPFGFINTSNVKLRVDSVVNSTVSLISNIDYFNPQKVGTQYKLDSIGQQASANGNAVDVATGSIRVTGVGTARNITVFLTTVDWTGMSVVLESSADEITWSIAKTYTANANEVYNDSADNSILYYRLRVDTYNVTPVVMQLTYAGGSITGICEVTSYTSTTQVEARVLRTFGSATFTENWYEGEWSEEKGYPTCVHLYEGRLFWAGKDRIWGSESDNYTGFDDEVEGDGQPIGRTIGFGAVENVEWLLDSGRMIMGLASDEVQVRSSSFGEILTNFNCNLRAGTSQGVAPVQPLRQDGDIVFVQRSGIKMIRTAYDMGRDANANIDLMTLHENICQEGIKRIAISRQPETRIYVVLNNGEMRVYLTDPAENVSGWCRITHGNGSYEDVVVFPATGEDTVVVSVNRGGTRYIERFNKVGDFFDRHLDSAVVYSSPPIGNLSGLDHLEGLAVGLWGDGQDIGSATVTSGEVAIGGLYTDVVVGLRYNADYVSNKLGQYASYTVLNERIRVVNMGILGRDIYPQSIQYGYDLTDLQPMPLIEDGTTFALNSKIQEYDHTPFEFNGSYDTNSRVAIRATNPCIIMALTYEIKDSEYSKYASAYAGSAVP